MGAFDQTEYDSLAPYEQKQYEMDNPRPRAKRGSSSEAGFDRMMKGVSENAEGKEKIEKNLENYRSKIGSDIGGRTVRSGGGSSGVGNGAEIKTLQNPRVMKKGGKVSSASKRADGCAQRGKTKGKYL
jgi:hypothetical protein